MKKKKRDFVQIEEGLRLRKKKILPLRRPIEHVAQVAAEMEGLQIFDVQIILADNAFIQKLNQMYRQINQPTDVLSFPANDLTKPLAEVLKEGYIPELSEDGKTVFLGEIYISVDRAEEQAVEYGNTLQEELCFLTVHGMLHLMGYDHINPEDEKIMRQKQRLALGRNEK